MKTLRSAEDILNQMCDIMPFELPNSIVPYIEEAIKVTQRETLEAAADNAKIKIVPILGTALIDKQSILNLLDK